MPYEDPGPDDPMLRMGVVLPADEASEREMAWVFAEEFARMGFGQEEILALFRLPFYAGAHDTFLKLGEEAVTAIVKEAQQFWGRIRLVDREPETGGPAPARGARVRVLSHAPLRSPLDPREPAGARAVSQGARSGTGPPVPDHKRAEAGWDDPDEEDLHE